ncbi:GAP1-N1 domain-containing protein [Pseudomonas putida]|uniref:GAP1-N1 domain-containing protein n=1 Tax=Pseudomonas putida TaxID=303 RepID=UPI0012FBDD07|nr:hypothetical protein [Pseudomonas putida]
MKIDQALFGYEGGHRLLASSLPLGSDAPLLTELSDVAPGAIFGSGDGYWTGLPLPSMKRYALLRTWPAPEMSRPGCVWTHALLLDPKILELFKDLSVLQNLANRPIGIVDQEKYRHSIEVSLKESQGVHHHSDDEITANLIFKLYGQKEAVIKTTTPGELVEPLFAVWSQQWPRLRRNFRFQTALTRNARGTSSIRLDITTILASSADLALKETPKPSWVRAAQQDIDYGHDGALRSFLRRYGADVKKQKASFKPLVELSLLNNKPTADATDKVLRILAEAFPSTEDAKSLKQDLINGDLIPSAQPGLVYSLLMSESADILPMPSADGLARIANLDPKSSHHLVQMAELAIISKTPISSTILELLIYKITNSSQTWILENSSSSVVRYLCKHKPSLVTDKTINSLSDEDLIYSLPFITHNPVSLKPLIAQILSRESKDLATALFDFAPQATAAAVLKRLSESGSASVSIWVTELFKRSSLLLHGNVLESASTSDAIFECINGLGWLSPEVLKAGCTPWMKSIDTLNPNLLSKKEELIAAYFTVLALQTGQNSGLSIIERFFDILHSKLIDSDLNKQTVEFLLPHLTNVSFFKGWDLGLRLRLSVVDAYVRFNWPRNSFLNLTPRKKTRKMLAEAASDTTEGNYYADESLL